MKQNIAREREMKEKEKWKKRSAAEKIGLDIKGRALRRWNKNVRENSDGIGAIHLTVCNLAHTAGFICFERFFLLFCIFEKIFMVIERGLYFCII